MRGTLPMNELEWDPTTQRPSLRRAVRHRVRDLARPCRIVAEDFLAADSRIDLLGVGLEGELVSIRIGGAAHDSDAQILIQSLSDLAWLRDRTEDFVKLAPGLGIESSASARAIILCPSFRQDTHLAVECLPAGRISLLTYRAYRHQGQLNILLDEAATSPIAHPGQAHSMATSGTQHQIQSRPAAPPEPSREPVALNTAEKSPGALKPGFRTGLTEADLHPEVRELIDID